MMIDTHCHIYGSEMENAEDIIRQACENDITVILNGTDPSSNREVLELSAKHEMLMPHWDTFIPLLMRYVMRTFAS